MSIFKSSPSSAISVIIPSPNFLWYIVCPILYFDKFTPIGFVLMLFRKLSAVLNAKLGCGLFVLLPAITNDIAFLFELFPYVHSVFSFSLCGFSNFSTPSSSSFGISSRNLD